MNLQKLTFFLLFIFLGFVFSCKKPAPQLPSNKGNVVDENEAALLKVNTGLAFHEDSVLADYVKTLPAKYIKSGLGFWYHINEKSDGDFLKDKETCHLEYKLLLMDGQIVQKADLNFTLGKKEVVTGFEEAVKLLRKGEVATFIIPWYLAYGRKGLEPSIPPYTSLVYKVKLYK